MCVRFDINLDGSTSNHESWLVMSNLVVHKASNVIRAQELETWSVIHFPFPLLLVLRRLLHGYLAIQFWRSIAARPHHHFSCWWWWCLFLSLCYSVHVDVDITWTSLARHRTNKGKYRSRSFKTPLADESGFIMMEGGEWNWKILSLHLRYLQLNVSPFKGPSFILRTVVLVLLFFVLGLTPTSVAKALIAVLERNETL